MNQSRRYCNFEQIPYEGCSKQTTLLEYFLRQEVFEDLLRVLDDFFLTKRIKDETVWWLASKQNNAGNGSKKQRYP